jgi:hypothetical protein
MVSMLLATGVLIGTTVTLVIVSIIWYRKDERKRLE